MRTLRTFAHLARADFLERVRRSSFLTVLALTVWAGYLFVPPEDAGYLVLNVGLKRGIYGSAWIGLMFGLIAAMHLPLFGFYLVKNAVARDRQTGVGQIIATTPIGKLVYVAGKWLSNLAVLLLILSVMTLMAVVMQLIRAEAATVDLRAIAAPICLMGLPVLAIAAAMAVLFESVSFLRGSLGNVAYFFIWGAVLATALEGGIDEATGLAQPFDDIFGYTHQLADIQQQVLAAEPGAGMSSGLITPVRGRQVGTFVWDGVDWTVRVVGERVKWAGLALAIVVASAIPFDRFDPARSGRGSASTAGAEGKALLRRLRGRLKAVGSGALLRRDAGPTNGVTTATATHLTPLAGVPARRRFFGVLVAELKLMVRGRGLLWYGGTTGLIIACLVSPLADVRQYLVPALWLWPIPILSQMGMRERRHNTSQIVFSAPQPVGRQLPAMWLAGVILTIVAGTGGWIRLALVGDAAALLGWFVGVLFAPSLALALGVWAGNSRAFELIYALWWYIGVVNRIPAFDYAGVTADGLAIGMPLVYLGTSLLLVALAAIGRSRQVDG